ncbi:protein translocase subunit SecF [Desulfohalovibrio reitneri]|uniref:protein translocase subunit SecF n=1 Tax=Desulfohalovibrio reitneri TaxID=1307759 RepID=UPI0004A704D6|nr:protein translocase subunit SecF [Desulfohalovibrio reitneri]
MGLSIIKPDTRINFIGYRKVAFVLSAVILFLGVGSLLIKGGPSYGIDFSGGQIVQIKFDSQPEFSVLKDGLEETGLPGLTVQRFGQDADNEYLLRISASEIPSDTLRDTINSAIGAALPQANHHIQRLEMVGPKVGADLRAKALEALFYAVLLIAIYISGRFEQRWFASAVMAGGLALGIYLLKLIGVPLGGLILAALAITVGLCWKLKLNYALGAVTALIHDVTITVGVFSLLNKEFDLTIVAALLTIIGYSLNDTIIVFDRIRENIRGKAKQAKRDFAALLNGSINQTLSRTLLTSGTTLLVVLCLYLFGGGVIHDFAFALLIGVLVGTYSSVFVAAPILLGFDPATLQREPKEEQPEENA